MLHAIDPPGFGLTAVLVARAGCRDELLQTLRTLIPELALRPGCISSLVAQDVGDEPRFLLHLRWRDVGALQDGLASEPYRILLGATSTLTTSDGMTLLPSLSDRAFRRLIHECAPSLSPEGRRARVEDGPYTAK